MFGTDGVAMRHKLLQAKWLPCSDGLDSLQLDVCLFGTRLANESSFQSPKNSFLAAGL